MATMLIGVHSMWSDEIVRRGRGIDPVHQGSALLTCRERAAPDCNTESADSIESNEPSIR